MPKRRTASRRSDKRRTVRIRPSRRRTSRRKPNRRKPSRRRTAKGLESWFRKKLLNQYSPDEYVSGRRYRGPSNFSHEAEMRNVDKVEAAQRDNKAMNIFSMRGTNAKEGRKHWEKVSKNSIKPRLLELQQQDLQTELQQVLQKRRAKAKERPKN